MIDEPVETGAEAAEPLYTPEFAKDPSAVYRRLRETYGPLAPVELDPGVTATLCVGYDTALEILRRPETFSKDPRRWRAKNEGRVPDTSHAGRLIRYRPQPTAVDGEEHQRYRSAIDDSTSRIDPGALRGYVERIADSLIDQFCDAGEADLIGEYSALLPLLVLGELFGCPREIADRLFTGLAHLFDGTDVAEADRTITEALQELVALKRARPAADITSWLIAHPERLADHELVEQLMLLTASGSDPVINLIGNALRVLMTDDRFAGGVSGGSMLVDDALDEVLWADPPLANFAVHFPRHDVTLAGVRLREGEPIVISFAAANQEALRTSDRNRGNRGHLAFSAGPHMCPGRSSARLIASVALEKLLDRLPEVELAGPEEELRWRPGIYQRGLISLPARFPPTPRDPAPAQPAPVAAGAEAVPAGLPGEAPASGSASAPGAAVPGSAPAPGAGAVPGPGSGSPLGAASVPAPDGAPGAGAGPDPAPVPSWAEGSGEEAPAAGGDGDGGRRRPSMLGYLMRWRRRR
ncbi:cytochrome P450 [Streptomyces sp. NPDC019937]|uniref:cytochrome P450 n=1 Tax=Streptomyces sp. NPDC019937 TaxID=3154787 RepID=UPI0033FF0DC9